MKRIALLAAFVLGLVSASALVVACSDDECKNCFGPPYKDTAGLEVQDGGVDSR